MSRTKEVGQALMMVMTDLARLDADRIKNPQNYGDHMREQILLETKLADIFSDTEKKPMHAKSWGDGEGNINAVAWDVDKDNLN